MRLALLSDIHGNSIALDAVLADAERAGPIDGYWVLGDLAAIGPDPVGAVERVAALPNARVLRGNADRYSFSTARPRPNAANVAADPDKLAIFADVAHTFAWTQGALTATGWLDWLAALPLALRTTLPDGTRLLTVHATPQCDDCEQGLNPHLSDEQMCKELGGCEAELVVAGHTHWPLNRRVDGWHVVNLGSVSNPTIPSLQATYCLLEANERGYQIEHRWVDYDRDAVVRQIETVRHPSGAYIIDFLRGALVRHSWGDPKQYIEKTAC